MNWLTHAHNGDNERVAIHVVRSSADADDWQIDYLEINRHFDPPAQVRWGWGPEIPIPENADDWSAAIQTALGNNRFLYRRGH